jgi:hypothetical protein
MEMRTYRRRTWSGVPLVGMVVLGMMGFVAVPSQAEPVGDRFVATTGDDASDCASPETACRTLAGALAKADPGATVRVSPGSYPETSIIRVDATIQGAGADATVLGPISIWNRAVTATIAEVAIAGGNRSGGGGIENSGTLTLRNSVVRDNAAWAGEGYQAFGAGVFNLGTLTLLDSTVRDNTAVGIGDDERSGWGGGVHNRGTLIVTGSTISGNKAHVGAGLYNAGVATLTTSTVSGNAAKVDGGGIATTSSGTTSLAFVTVTGNVSDSDENGTGDGGGIAAIGPTVASGSILGANRDPGDQAPDCAGVLESRGRNLVTDAAGCALTGGGDTDLTGVDANLGPLADNGGPTLTHAPLEGSPALDAAGADGCSDSDQRGVARPQGDACDVGAVEVVASPPVEECPCSLWDNAAEPLLLEDPDRVPVELGVRFRAEVDGYVTGIRFFKGPNNTGTHTGTLWSSDGHRLATGTFADDTGPGWQDLTFDEPVPIQAGDIHVASYHAPSGRYSVDENYFNQGPRQSGPLEALANTEDGGNGVYNYGEESRFPTNTFRASNYWVDVRFIPASKE